MELPQFIESVACVSRTNCVACRDLVRGPKLWAAWSKVFAMPDACPRQLPMGWKSGVVAKAPAPAEPWPRLVQLLARMARPGDKGVGDTLERMLRKKGGDLFKRAYKKITGQDCNCGDRQAKLNAKYPYRDSTRVPL